MAELLNKYGDTNIGGNKAARCEVRLDSLSELSTLTEIDGYTLTDGSIAWDIENGDFYALKNGTWYNQDGSGEP